MTDIKTKKEPNQEIFDEIEREFGNSKRSDELDLLYNSFPIIVAEPGQVVNGTYLGKVDDQYVFSVRGFKDDVRIDSKPSEEKYISSLDINDKIEILITSTGKLDNYMIKGSVQKLYETEAHNTLRNLDKDTPVLAHIKSLNPAGYSVEILKENANIAAFMPNTLAGVNKLVNPEFIVGQTFEVLIESFSENEGTYIVSRKRYLKSLIPEEIEKLNYEDVYTGHVTGTTSFGVFVEFNECLTGMVHKDNLNSEWQHKIQEINPGTEIDFYVKDVIKNKKNYKIILTQNYEESIWDDIEQGQVYTGTVKAIKNYGILVELDGDTQGLIHSSEVSKIEKNLSKGDEVDVKVILADKKEKKIWLTKP